MYNVHVLDSRFYFLSGSDLEIFFIILALGNLKVFNRTSFWNQFCNISK